MSKADDVERWVELSSIRVTCEACAKASLLTLCPAGAVAHNDHPSVIERFNVDRWTIDKSIMLRGLSGIPWPMFHRIRNLEKEYERLQTPIRDFADAVWHRNDVIADKNINGLSLKDYHLIYKWSCAAANEARKLDIANRPDLPLRDELTPDVAFKYFESLFSAVHAAAIGEPGFPELAMRKPAHEVMVFVCDEFCRAVKQFGKGIAPEQDGTPTDIESLALIAEAIEQFVLLTRLDIDSQPLGEWIGDYHSKRKNPAASIARKAVAGVKKVRAYLKQNIDTVNVLPAEEDAKAQPAITRHSQMTRKQTDEKRKKENNDKVREYLQNHPNASVRKVSKAISISMGAISELPAWKAEQAIRAEAKPPKKTAVVRLTSKSEQIMGVEDEGRAEIDRLIDEQRADDRQRCGSPRQAQTFRSRERSR